MPKATTTTTSRTTGGTFSAEERAAMKERAKELKAEAARGSAAEKAAAAERDVLAKIAEMPQEDRVMAERIHAIVRENAPELATRLWYGMPAYTKDGKVVCFVKPATKFGSRYTTLGFEDMAHLDDGNMWPTSYALTSLTPGEEQRIAALVKKAAG